MPLNALFFPALSTISPEPTEKWRFATKTSNTYKEYLSMDLIFRYTNNNSEFNLTSTTPYKYMTLFHMGTDSSTSGFQVCLCRKDLDSNPIQIGVRYSEGTGWNELSGSFVNLSDVDGADVDTDGFMILLQYNYNNPSTLVNFYVTKYAIGPYKTSPDFTFTTSSGPNVKPIGVQWGFGSVPESITDSMGYVSSENYNSFVAQNIVIDFVRTWNYLLPVTSATAETWALFNTTDSTYSVYDNNRLMQYLPATNDVVPPTPNPNLNFQLFVPNDNLLTNLANNAISPAELMTATESTTAFPTLNPPTSYNFAVNTSTGLNIIAKTTLACILIGSHVLTIDGFKRVEQLTLNDILITGDNRKTSIVQIEKRHVTGDDGRPFKIPIGCYGALQNVYVSYGHALLIGNMFCPAFLLNLDRGPKRHLYTYYMIQTTDFIRDTLNVDGVITETWGGWEPGMTDYEVNFDTKSYAGYPCRLIQNPILTDDIL